MILKLNNIPKDLSEKIHNLTEAPGVYLYKDVNDLVIYVGKAKNLKKRVSSYFYRTSGVIFVKHIKNLDVIVTNSELESLILEQNLIKKYQPKYNVLFRDDKKYPYIVLTEEKFPRLLYLRKIDKKLKGKYFGPFPDGVYALEIYKILNRIFPLRKCYIMPKKTCIYYDIGQCLAPCVNDVNPSRYDEYKKEINNFFSSNDDKIIDFLYKKIEYCSNKMLYESAHKYNNLLESIKKNIKHSKNIVELQVKSDWDVIGYFFDSSYIVFSVLVFRAGRLLNTISKIYVFNNDVDSLLKTFIYSYYLNNIPGKYVLTKTTESSDLEFLQNKFNFKLLKYNPKNKKYFDLACNNAKNYLKMNKFSKIHQIERQDNAWHELENLVGKKINYIDIYDNSNIAGKRFVSGVITYFQGNKINNLTRKFNLPNDIKDDLGAFTFVVQKKMLSKSLVKPDLIIVDGGKAQVNAIKQGLKLINIPTFLVLGLCKDKSHKTNYLFFNNKSIYLDKSSDLFLYLMYIQEDIHKTIITFFRKKQINSLFLTELSKIPGVGIKTAHKLIDFYGDIRKIKESKLFVLKNIVGNEKTAENILKYFNDK